MNILHVVSSIDPRTGGPAEAIRSVSVELLARGHSAEVISLDDPAADYMSDFVIKAHGVGPVSAKYGHTPKLGAWIAENRSRFDVAIVHGLWNHASNGGGKSLKANGLPYVIFPHGMMDPWFNKVQPIKRWAKQVFWLVGQGWVLADARFVLFTCEEERQLARNSFWGPKYAECVVAFGVAEPPKAQAGDEKAFRAAVPGLGDRDYLLFLSRIHQKKGCDLLVEGFARVAAANPQVDLVIAGPDQVGWRADLEKIAREAGIGDRVHFPGMLQGGTKWGAFRGARAFILPSHQENFGIVVPEAMACGTPVLISNKVNIWREVAGAGAGLVQPDTLEGTTKLMTDFFALSPADYEDMRLKARKGFEDKFGMQGATDDLENVLRTAMEKTGR